MREIKFRAWDKQTKQWFERFEWNLTDGWCLLTPPTVPLMKLTTRYDIMQYTGLKDKNGKEIYEGDIIKDTEDALYNNGIMIVKFSDCWFYGIDKHERQMDLSVHEHFEIIGNIYEDPNLVKE